MFLCLSQAMLSLIYPLFHILFYHTIRTMFCKYKLQCGDAFPGCVQSLDKHLPLLYWNLEKWCVGYFSPLTKLFAELFSLTLTSCLGPKCLGLSSDGISFVHILLGGSLRLFQFTLWITSMHMTVNLDRVIVLSYSSVNNPVFQWVHLVVAPCIQNQAENYSTSSSLILSCLPVFTCCFWYYSTTVSSSSSVYFNSLSGQVLSWWIHVTFLGKADREPECFTCKEVMVCFP